MSEVKWAKLCRNLSDLFNIETSQIESILFLIGLQELQKFDVKFSKDSKLDIIHIGTCTLLSMQGYYKLSYRDEEGWPHFENIKILPAYNTQEQTLLLKNLILEYFSTIFNLS